MLKITNNNGDGGTTFKLEGKLTGAWVNELRSCWEQAGKDAAIRVDLTEVSWVSEDGKALLGEMHRRGAKLSAENLLMAAIVAEIRAETTD
jgi:ABC-type transporter Mla MlaB component